MEESARDVRNDVVERPYEFGSGDGGVGEEVWARLEGMGAAAEISWPL